MKILHGTWIPDANSGFIQSGAFYLWIETTEQKRFKGDQGRHPRQLPAAELATALTAELGINAAASGKLGAQITPQYFLLPSADGQPLPSLELSRYLETDLRDDFDLQYWQVDCYKMAEPSKRGAYSSHPMSNVVHQLNDLHFIALHNLADIQLGSDLLFWFHYTQALKRVIFKDHYIPALKYRDLTLPEEAPPEAPPTCTSQATTKAKTKSTKKSADKAAPETATQSAKTKTTKSQTSTRKASKSTKAADERAEAESIPEESAPTRKRSRSQAATIKTTRRIRATSQAASQTASQSIPVTATPIPAESGKSSKSTKSTKSSQSTKAIPDQRFEIYPAWELVGDEYETNLRQYVDYMPLICVSGFAEPSDTAGFYDRELLLRHFSECLLSDLVTTMPTTQAFEKTIAESLVYDCLHPRQSGAPWTTAARLEQYSQWQQWRDRITHSQTNVPFYLGFQLQDPLKAEDPWLLQFQVSPKDDPSLRLSLDDYWRMSPEQQQQLKSWLGNAFEQHLLMNLGYAARIYPRLWSGLETDQPVGIVLNLDSAFEFLKESAWVLESAGYKVIVPSWWTPQGRRRAKIRLKASGKSLSGGDDKAKQYFSFETLVQYQYELAIGDQPISETEWNQLVNAKTPLVKVRGQWMELDQAKMQQMLEFWKKQQQENPELSLLDFLKLSANGSDDDLELDYDRDGNLATMMARLHDKNRLEPVEAIANLHGTLRDYQKRGVSWLHYLEQLGLNGCLADDMGLGKTVQVIARLVHERELAQQAGTTPVAPTLLVAPTSVVGNWQREIGKFAPHLRVIVHHGSQRSTDPVEFKQACRTHDVLITSFALARKDVKLLGDINWHRIVLDEAQNIKNPKSDLTKAILKLPATHRLALTGTPIENRLLDLWSIFQFLNPGYLGNQTQFRRSFELPIQKNNDPRQSATLKKLVEPFILRRVKTDQSIIKDLPDKVEQKLYCNLTKEQASLYEAVVKSVEEQLQTADGIQRKGLILATLTKLKQICNHPMQFLQDGSEFTTGRSHKLSRLSEMLEEVMQEGESVLIFTQFNELGEALEKYLRHTCHYNTYYLHGGTARPKREQMIAEFQNPETEPSIFVLSLKAGGVGITLTKANHVFHFDRWWNPAVEDQATDRAFRIGQTKNVFVHKFVALGTLEERIDEMIADKKKLAGAIVGADESWLSELDNDAFKKLIALNKSAILE